MSAEPIKTIPKPLKFVFGGAAGMGSCLFTQPFDLLKNRMQVSGEGTRSREHRTSAHAFRSIWRNEGMLAVYNGLTAGLFRQGTYTTMRLGLYTWMFEAISTRRGGEAPRFWQKTAIGLAAGGVASFVCTPAELALIRMTTDGRLPADQRRRYRHVFDALTRIVREEGLLILYRGCTPTVVRAMVVNASQLATYSQTKGVLLTTLGLRDTIGCHLTASLVSAFVAAVASLPVDIAKTRVQNMKVLNGVAEYNGAVDAIVKIVRHEGFGSLWKGFSAYFLRAGPHTILTFLFLERLNSFYYKYVLQIEKQRGGL